MFREGRRKTLNQTTDTTAEEFNYNYSAVSTDAFYLEATLKAKITPHSQAISEQQVLWTAGIPLPRPTPSHRWRTWRPSGLVPSSQSYSGVISLLENDLLAASQSARLVEYRNNLPCTKSWEIERTKLTPTNLESIRPILSRNVEQYVAQSYIYPASIINWQIHFLKKNSWSCHKICMKDLSTRFKQRQGRPRVWAWPHWLRCWSFRSSNRRPWEQTSEVRRWYLLNSRCIQKEIQ